jgi:ABC1 atypical kinase-like domain
MRALDVAGLWTRREARVMDMISLNLAKIRPRVEVPTSIPGLVTKRVLVMKFLDGVPMTQLATFTSGLSVAKQKAAFKRVRCAALTSCYTAVQMLELLSDRHHLCSRTRIATLQMRYIDAFFRLP